MVFIAFGRCCANFLKPARMSPLSQTPWRTPPSSSHSWNLLKMQYLYQAGRQPKLDIVYTPLHPWPHQLLFDFPAIWSPLGTVSAKLDQPWTANGQEPNFTILSSHHLWKLQSSNLLPPDSLHDLVLSLFQLSPAAEQSLQIISAAIVPLTIRQ